MKSWSMDLVFIQRLNIFPEIELDEKNRRSIIG